MLETLVYQLGEELHMEDQIGSSQTGSYTLPFDDDIEVKVSPVAQKLILWSVIAPCPQTNKEAFFAKVMEANLFGRGTRGAAIGLSEDGNLLTLSAELDYNATYKDFKEKLEDFITIVDYWRKEAQKHR